MRAVRDGVHAVRGFLLHTFPSQLHSSSTRTNKCKFAYTLYTFCSGVGEHYIGHVGQTTGFLSASIQKNSLPQGVG